MRSWCRAARTTPTPTSRSTVARANVPRVEAEILRAVPKLGPAGRLGSGPHTSVAVAKAERAIEPESIALGVFGAIAALATLLIAGSADRTPAPSRRRRARRVARARGRPGDNHRRRSPRRPRSGGARCAAGRGRGCRALAARAARPGPPSRAPEHRLRLDRSRRSASRASWSCSARSRWRSRTARRRTGDLAGRQRARGRGSRAGRAAANAGLPAPAVTGIRFALEPGGGSERGAGALRDHRCRPRDGRRDVDVDVRHEPADARVASRVVRMELELRAALRVLGRRGPAAETGRDPARPRSLRERLDRRLLRRSRHRRPGRARDGLQPERLGRAADSSRATASTPRTRSCSAPATLAKLHKHVGDTVEVKTGPRKATTTAHRRNGDDAGDREQHDDGRRRVALVSALPAQTSSTSNRTRSPDPTRFSSASTRPRTEPPCSAHCNGSTPR